MWNNNENSKIIWDKKKKQNKKQQKKKDWKMQNIKEIIVQWLCAFVPCNGDSLVPGQMEAELYQSTTFKMSEQSHLLFKSTVLKFCLIWSAVQSNVRRALLREIMVTFYL